MGSFLATSVDSTEQKWVYKFADINNVKTVPTSRLDDKHVTREIDGFRKEENETEKSNIRRLQLIMCNFILVHLNLVSTFRNTVSKRVCVVCGNLWEAIRLFLPDYMSTKLIRKKWSDTNLVHPYCRNHIYERDEITDLQHLFYVPRCSQRNQSTENQVWKRWNFQESKPMPN